MLQIYKLFLKNTNFVPKTSSQYEKAVCFALLYVDGYIRDKQGLDEIGMPMFSRGYKPASPAKVGPGAINTEVECGKVTVNPGDLIMSDCDGIVCVPRDMIEEVLTKAEEKVAYEVGRVNAIANYTKCKEEGKELPDLTPGWVKEMLGM